MLSHRVMPASTVGTFLRSFTVGHTRQLDRVTGAILARAWAAGAEPGDGPLTIDVDSTICEAHGYYKQGACYGYTHGLGYHPLPAFGPTPARCCMPGYARARPTPPRGIVRFLDELVARVCRPGASGELTLRMEGFWSAKTLKACAATGFAPRSRCARPRPSARRSPRSPSTAGSISPPRRAGSRRSPRLPTEATAAVRRRATGRWRGRRRRSCCQPERWGWERRRSCPASNRLRPACRRR